MKWIVFGLFFAGLLCCAFAWRESIVGNPNPTGDQWERQQAAPLGWVLGLVLIVAAVVLAGVYADIKALLF